MLVKMGGSAGGGIDYNSKPQITFDGKWSNWYIEFYGGVPYWEALLTSSGTLRVTGDYTADVCGVGGGAGINNKRPGNGAFAQKLGIDLSGSIAVTIGAGGEWSDHSDGGDTTLGGVFSAAKGVVGVKNSGTYYRFGDPDKASEAGADGISGGIGWMGYGGWMHGRASQYSGEGYGARGGSSGYAYGTVSDGHPGALVIRIPIE